MFDRDYQMWNDYNEELLKALFTTDDYGINYRWAVEARAIVGQESGAARFRRLKEHIRDRLTYLESLGDRLEVIPVAASADSGTIRSPTASLDLLWPLLHSEVQKVARPRFDSRQYADAVEAAFKGLNNAVKALVKARGGPEMDGAALMHTAFSPKSPLIALADLGTQTGKDQQQGYMELFAGSMSAIRNPKAHDNVTITPERAMHLLFLASTLWHTLDTRM